MLESNKTPLIIEDCVSFNILKQNLEILSFINYIQHIERALTEHDFHSLK